jgi:MoaA/NifB/PqqE/SkfB family radical SAM enzyme
MYKLSDIQILHLEISSQCNAECPQCPRNFYGYPLNFGYAEHNMTLTECRRIFPIEFIQQLKELKINGNFGDMVMNPESLDIIKYFKDNNPDLIIKISTNGGARNQIFWTRLAAFNADVYFCIDGLEDTHSLYRRNTVYSTVLSNAQTFISAGGLARWRFIKFDHNQHQIKEAHQLSMDLGFESFELVDDGRNTGPVFNKEKELVYRLGNYQGPTDFDAALKNSQLEDTDLNNVTWSYFDKLYDVGNINCQAVSEKSIYVNSVGELYPCCWIGTNPHTYGDKQKWFSTVNATLRLIIKDNNVQKFGLKTAIKWFDQIKESWTKPDFKSGQLLTCNQQCGKKCS